MGAFGLWLLGWGQRFRVWGLGFRVKGKLLSSDT